VFTEAWKPATGEWLTAAPILKLHGNMVQVPL
jgi:hypothetical protein